MDLPNIYKMTDYRGLIAAPLILILLSLYFIPSIPKGIDFKGGILITLQTNSSFEEAKIQGSLANIGIKDMTISSYTHPFGKTIEIEIEQNPLLAEAEKARIPFSNTYDEVIDLEYRKTTIELDNQRNSSNIDKNAAELAKIESQLAPKRAEMDKYAQTILSNCGQVLGRQIGLPTGSTKEVRDAVDKVYLEATDTYNKRILEALRSSVEFSSYSFVNVMPSLSDYFISKVLGILIVSTILVVIVVFVVFRTFVPSMAVLSGALSDVIIAMGGMGLFGIPLTLSSFATLLMLIGFSLDTDMLLTLRVIKRTEGTARGRAYEAMKTGITMSSATILSFSVLLALALITHIATYYQIAAVAICGLFGDIVATWFFNAVIVLWYAEKKEREKK
jgi:preprotein translocase subunit SecF